MVAKKAKINKQHAAVVFGVLWRHESSTVVSVHIYCVTTRHMFCAACLQFHDKSLC